MIGMDESPDQADRTRFLHACADLLGQHLPATDRELALAALAVMCARTPRDAPLDAALRSFVLAVAPLVGAPDIESMRVTPEALRAVKRQVTADALSIGSTIIILDSTQENVDLPAQLMGVKDVKLRLGYGLTPAIADLALEVLGWRATLSFQGVLRACYVPWDAVWAVGSEVTQEGVGWPTSAPEGYDANGGRPQGAPDVRVLGTRPKLGVIKGGLDLTKPISVNGVLREPGTFKDETPAELEANMQVIHDEITAARDRSVQDAPTLTGHHLDCFYDTDENGQRTDGIVCVSECSFRDQRELNH